MDRPHTISLEPDPPSAAGDTPDTAELPNIEVPEGRAGRNSARVRTIIAAYVGEGLLPHLLDTADLTDLKVDPLDRLGITCALDEAFLIEIPDVDEEGWTTVSDVVKTVQRLAA